LLREVAEWSWHEWVAIASSHKLLVLPTCETGTIQPVTEVAVPLAEDLETLRVTIRTLAISAMTDVAHFQWYEAGRGGNSWHGGTKVFGQLLVSLAPHFFKVLNMRECLSGFFSKASLESRSLGVVPLVLRQLVSPIKALECDRDPLVVLKA
jgi:hypothetical protein